MVFTITRCLGLPGIVFITLLLFNATTAVAAEAEPQGPVSLGAYFGPLNQFQPNTKVLVVYAESDVSFIPRQTLEAEKRNPNHYIHQTRHEQIVRLLELAKKLAAEHQAPAYALANLQVSTSVTSDAIIIETWG